MQIDLAEEYLTCYSLLGNKAQSKTANRRLLDIQDSQEGWAVAWELMSNQNGTIRVHGQQLFNKKLNLPLSYQVDAQKIVKTLLAVDKKTTLVWLCIAKLLVHLSPHTPLMPAELTQIQRLMLLKEIPAAVVQVRVRGQNDSIALNRAYLTLCVECVREGKGIDVELVIEVLDSFVSYGVPIKDPALVGYLLSLPFEVSFKLVEDILSRQSFPTLKSQILSYLSINSHRQDVYQTFVAVLRNMDMAQLQFLEMKEMIGFVLEGLTKEEGISRLTQSYQLWLDLSNLFKGDQLPPNKQQLVKDALMTVWNLVCRKALLVKMPERKIQVSSLALSVDQDEEEDNNNGPVVQCQANRQVDYFRDHAGDFLVLCVQTLLHLPQVLQTLFAICEQVAAGQPLHVQLSIYIIYSLTGADNLQLLLPSVPTIRLIFSRFAQMNQYVCSKVLQLIGELSRVLEVTQDLLSPVLLFLSGCLQYDQLSVIASENLCRLLEEVKVQGGQVGDSMEKFMAHTYQSFFREDGQETMVNNLARAMAIYIYKFKRRPQDYDGYLGVFLKQCQGIPRAKLGQLLKACMAGQFWINSQETRKSEDNEDIEVCGVNNFMEPFGQFLQKQGNFFVEGLRSGQKEQLKDGINIINIAIKTLSIGNGVFWFNLSDYLLSNYLSDSPPLPNIISPLVNLIKSSRQIQNKQLLVMVVATLKKWWRPVTNLLDFSHSRHNANLQEMVLRLHLETAKLIKKWPACKNQIEYTPEVLVGYLIGSICNKQIWNFDVFKGGLSYFNLVIQMGYPPLQILTCLLSQFDKLQEALWHSLNPVISIIYKHYGYDIFVEALTSVGSPLSDRTNPLSQELHRALETTQSKTVKNLLMCL